MTSFSAKAWRHSFRRVQCRRSSHRLLTGERVLRRPGRFVEHDFTRPDTLGHDCLACGVARAYASISSPRQADHEAQSRTDAAVRTLPPRPRSPRNRRLDARGGTVCARRASHLPSRQCPQKPKKRLPGAGPAGPCAGDSRQTETFSGPRGLGEPALSGRRTRVRSKLRA